MKYMLLVFHNEEHFAALGEAKHASMLDESIRLARQVSSRGQYLAAPLQPTATATCIRVRDQKTVVTDGPYAETHEQLAGYFLIDAKSLDEAIGIAAKVPGAKIGTIEIRPIRDVPGLPLPSNQQASVGDRLQSHDRHDERKEREMQLQPYLFFEGRCEEAARFYEKAVGARIGRLLRFKDSPDQSLCGGAESNKVMHMTLQVGDQTIMASDGQCQGSQAYQGFALSLTVTDEAEAERRFNALAEGGQVTQPLMKTFFSPRFGMLTDRFGVSWMIHAAP